MMRNRTKRIDFKVKVDNTGCFIRLGNILPTQNAIEILRLSMSSDLLQLLSDITNNNVSALFNEYKSKSSLKTLSTLLENTLEETGLVLIDNEYYLPNSMFYNGIMQNVEMRYLDKWTKLLATLKLDYNPIKPYDMEITDHLVDTHGGNTEIDRNAKRTIDTLTENEVISDETDNKIYGFNSSEGVNADKTINTSNDTSKDTGSVEDDATILTKHGRTVDSSRDVTRKGNIGNITQQELINKERELLQYQIFDTIYKDLDRVFTRSKYI